MHFSRVPRGTIILQLHCSSNNVYYANGTRLAVSVREPRETTSQPIILRGNLKRTRPITWHKEVLSHDQNDTSKQPVLMA